MNEGKHRPTCQAYFINQFCAWQGHPLCHYCYGNTITTVGHTIQIRIVDSSPEAMLLLIKVCKLCSDVT